MEHAARYDGDDAAGGNGRPGADETVDKAMAEIREYLSAGLANVVNFIRPNRLVIVSELTRYAAFNDAVTRSIRSRLLTALVHRVRIDLWEQADSHSAETAGWLALASLYREGWNRRAQDMTPIAARA
jgi:predicted NBD/HSP70 family sugar kinase